MQVYTVRCRCNRWIKLTLLLGLFESNVHGVYASEFKIVRVERYNGVKAQLLHSFTASILMLVYLASGRHSDTLVKDWYQARNQNLSMLQQILLKTSKLGINPCVDSRRNTLFLCTVAIKFA